jgi:hypothetical protein
MEMSQGNFLYFKQIKMSFFFLSFLFCKVGELEGRTNPALKEGLAPVGAGRWQGKEVGW